MNGVAADIKNVGGGGDDGAPIRRLKKQYSDLSVSSIASVVSGGPVTHDERVLIPDEHFVHVNERYLFCVDSSAPPLLVGLVFCMCFK